MMSFTKITVLSAALLCGVAQAIETAVELGTAANYAILAKSGISTVPTSAITGDIGVSPISATAMTGFNLKLDSSNDFSTSTQVLGGKCLAASYTDKTAKDLTTTVGFMEAAYTDAAGRPNPDAARINLGDGILGGAYGGSSAPLTPGVYTFGSDVSFSTDVTFQGSDTDIFILQITGNLKVGPNYIVTLKDGAKAKNIFWQIAGSVEIGTSAQMEGILLVKTKVTFQTGSSLNGRILTQTAANLQSATITEPS
jgi:hypothetical protein